MNKRKKLFQIKYIYDSCFVDKLKEPCFNIKKPLVGVNKIKLQSCVKLAGYGIIHVAEDEVIDGWERIKIVKQLGLEKEVYTVNYGNISIAKRIILRRILNNQWSKIDCIKLSKALKKEILFEISSEKLSLYFPEDSLIIKELSKLCDFNWKDFDKHHPDTVMKPFEM